MIPKPFQSKKQNTCCTPNQEQEHKHEEHAHDCCCGQEHEEHAHGESCKDAGNAPVRTYIVENLDCANCAAKIERRIQSLPGVEYASLTFATKQLKVAAMDHETLLPLIKEACLSIEPDVTVIPKELSGKKPAGDEEEGRKDLLNIAAGAVLFAGGIAVTSFFPILSTALLVAAYLVLGLHIILTAIRNIFKGNLFDENFLMSIATCLLYTSPSPRDS